MTTQVTNSLFLSQGRILALSLDGLFHSRESHNQSASPKLPNSQEFFTDAFRDRGNPFTPGWRQEGRNLRRIVEEKPAKGKVRFFRQTVVAVDSWARVGFVGTIAGAWLSPVRQSQARVY